MVNIAKVYMLKLILERKSLKLLLCGMKVNSIILMGLGMVGMIQNKQKYFIFIVDSQIRVE